MSDLSDFLAFKKMITPVIIRALFWVGVVIMFFLGLKVMIWQNFFGGLFIMFLGPVMVRIWSELMLLFFAMNDTLTEIKNLARKNGPGTP
jgi:hypothetical protein